MNNYYTQEQIKLINQFMDLSGWLEPTFEDGQTYSNFQMELMGLIKKRSEYQDLYRLRDTVNYEGEKVLAHDFVSIHHLELKNLSARHGLTKWTDQIDDLESRGVLPKCRRPYDMKKKKTYGYNLTSNTWRNHKDIIRRTRSCRAPNVVTTNSISSKQKVEQNYPREQPLFLVKLQLEEAFKNLRFRADFFPFLERLYKQAIKGKISAVSLYDYQRQILSIVNGKYWASYTGTGRVYSSLTNLHRCLRRRLEINDDGAWKPLVEIDVKACVATILAYFYTYPTSVSIPKDQKEKEKKKYIHLIENKDFYTSMFNAIYKSRSHQKTAWSSYLNGGTNYKINLMQLSFQAEFPILYKILNALLSSHCKEVRKTVCEKTFEIESEIMVGDVFGHFSVRQVPIITIHDAILTTEEHLESILHHLKQAFINKLGITPQLEVTHHKKQ